MWQWQDQVGGSAIFEIYQVIIFRLLLIKPLAGEEMKNGLSFLFFSFFACLLGG